MDVLGRWRFWLLVTLTFYERCSHLHIEVSKENLVCLAEKRKWLCDLIASASKCQRAY